MPAQPPLNSTLPETNDALFQCSDATKYTPGLIDAIFFRLWLLGQDLAARLGGAGAVFAHAVAGENIVNGTPVAFLWSTSAQPVLVQFTQARKDANAQFAGIASESKGVGQRVRFVTFGAVKRGDFVSVPTNAMGQSDAFACVDLTSNRGEIIFVPRGEIADSFFIGFCSSNGDLFVNPNASPAPLAAREKIATIFGGNTFYVNDETLLLFDTNAGAITAFLPEFPFDGQRVTFKDAAGKAGLVAPLTVEPSGGRTIESGDPIETDKEYRTYVYSKAFNTWFVTCGGVAL